MVQLEDVAARIHRRLDRCDRVFAEIRAASPTISRVDLWIRLEGLLSLTWQMWNIFNRQLIMASCMGCQTRSGKIVKEIEPGITEHRVAYLAKCAVKRERAKIGRRVVFRREEPAWGNPNACIEIISRIRPSNQASLLAGLKIEPGAPEHLQLVRNATAHLNPDTYTEIRNLCIRYLGKKLHHPAELVFWTEPNSGSFAFWYWTESLRAIADHSVN